MKKIIFTLFMLLSAATVYSQESIKFESKFHLGVDLQSKYIWRGMEMMTMSSAPVVFPQINYQNKGFYAYVMGGNSINGKYSEVDLGVSYTYKWMTVGVNNYYYPSTTTAEDKYFNFKNNGTGHWFEGVVTFAPENLPAYLTVSNFFSGADKKADGKQAHSTYAEIGGHYDFLDDHNLSLAVGASFNKSCYNGYEHNFSICNIELKYTYNLAFRKSTLPLSVAYIINPIYEKAHVNFTASFAF